MLLCLADTVCGEHDVPRFLVNDIILLYILVALLGIVLLYAETRQFTDEGIHLNVHIRAFSAHARNNKRSARLVDKYGINLVDDGKAVSALDLALLVYRHIVAQVIEPHFGVCSVSDVRGVCGAALVRGHTV